MSTYKKLKQIKNITLLFILTIVLAFTTTILYLALQDKKGHIEQKIELQKINLELVFTKKINELESKYNKELEDFINNNDEIIDAFALKDRETLKRFVDKKFENYKKNEPNFEVICFGLPNQTAFYRAHAPHKFGDDIKNVQSVKEVTTTKKRMSGFIVSKLGIYYRVTFPVFKDSKYIGLIAFGMSLNYVNDFIQEELNTTSAIVVKTKDLKQSKWFNRLEEGTLGEYTVISSTADIVESAVESNLDISLKNSKFEHEKNIYNIINDIDIIGIKNKAIAKVILFQDITKETKIYKQYLYTFIVVLALLILVLLLVLILTFNKFLLTITSINKDMNRKNIELASLMVALDKNVITSEIDEDGNIVNVSEAFCKISGYSKDELIGKSYDIMKHTDMPEAIFENLWKTIRSDKTWKGEIKNLKKDGGYYWVKVIFSPKCTDKGANCGYTSINYDITDKKEVEDLTVNLELKIKERTIDLDLAKKEIEDTHKHTRDSIEYASLIQGALIPQKGAMLPYFKDHFVTWIPKDTVGGDIWLFEELRHNDECLLFFIDCTGHGVPGAFVTMIVKAVEREIVSILRSDLDMEISPAWIMGYFNRALKQLLRQETKDSLSNAGWDGGIIYYNKRTQILKFAGAETSLFFIDENGEFKIVKGDHYSVGYKKCSMDYKYHETIINVQEGMKFYCTTDGYLDQNGGDKDFPFGKKRFGNIIKENHFKPMIDQQNIFANEMKEYEGKIENNDRNDDMTLIAFEIDKQSDLKEDKVVEIVKYEGIMTQNVIAAAMDNIESKIINMGVMGNIAVVTIEYCQNIMNYSKNDNINSRQIVPAGQIEVQYVNDEYYDIIATNIISIDDKKIIEPKLIEIQSLDKVAIKKRYRELRKSGQNSHENGGGIGIYEIGKVSNSIEYEFRAINEDKYYFTMKSILIPSK